MNAVPASSRGALLVRLVSIAAVFCAVHLLTLAGDIRLAVLVFLGAMVIGPGAMSLRRLWRNRWVTVAMVAVLVAAIGAILAWPGAGTQAVLILPPFIGYMVTSAFFAHSLLPGDDPAITRMCRFLRGNVLPDGLEEYARLLTWGWAILPACLAVTAVVVFAVAGLEAWSWVTNVLSPLALVGFFVGEHIFRGIFYPHLGKPSLMQTFEVMFNSMAWRR
jgi:uncharacterized membrane protein